MTDRPIIYSAPMVRALLAGRKTQTRRLATSPLRKCEVGDRLYVREAFSVRGIYSDVVEVGYTAHRNASHTEYVEQIPAGRASGAKVTFPKSRPSIHMPRWASRLTLIVEGVKVEPLQAISEADAAAEGLIPRRLEGPAGLWVNAWHWLSDVDDEGTYDSAAAAYRALWSSLHTEEGQRWQDSPQVLALTFRAIAGNIDQVAVSTLPHTTEQRPEGKE